jgi:3-hydroxybutyryl-CoA dehydrogenase
MRALVAGELPLVEEISALCVVAGIDTSVYLVEDFLTAAESGILVDEITGADVVIEVHNESAASKRALLDGLGGAVPTGSLILTSALATSATLAASWLPSPARVVGFGLLPPLADKGLVELALPMQASSTALERAKEFWTGLGYESVVVADGPGLVRSRIVCCLINEAVSALHERVATASDIDQAMRLGTNYPFGPLEWADLMGLDTVLGVMNGLFDEWGEDRYRPSPLLRRMVLSGRLGRKSGEGFYRYGEETDSVAFEN